MINQVAEDELYNRIFDNVHDHIRDQRATNPRFTREYVQGILDSLYVYQGNDLDGRGKPADIKTNATIAAYEHALAEWQTTEGADS